MITIPLTDIKAKIKEQKGLSEEEINAKIKAKLTQLSGLISEEGAAHIIANELGIKLAPIPEKGEKIKVKNILTGMRNITVTGKITQKYELREFQTEKRSGKVANLILSDETGFIRLVLWNDQTDEFKNMKEGDILTIENGYVRENNGRKEIHINENSKITKNPEGVSIEAKTFENAERKTLSELKEEDENIEILGTIVQVFDPRFFEIDPETGRRAIQKEGKYYAGEKEVPEIGYAYVMNLFLDDGTDNVRTVLWKNQVQHLLELTDEEIIKFKDNPSGFEKIKEELLGTIIKVIGRANKNQNFDRIELIANRIIKDVNPEEEIAKIEEETNTEKTTEEEITTEELQKAVKEETTNKEEDDDDMLSIEDLEEI